jgi:hypothetical protein
MAETVFQKTTDERNVVDDRHVGQRPYFEQILLERVYTKLNRGWSACRALLARDHSFTSQELDEMSEGSRIPQACP